MSEVEPVGEAAADWSVVIVEHMASSNGHHAGGAAKGAELNKIEQRRREVACLMAAHFTYREMAEKLGVASSTISEDVKAIGEQRRQRATADYATFLAEEIAKLDLLEREVLAKALSLVGVGLHGAAGQLEGRVFDVRQRRARGVHSIDCIEERLEGLVGLAAYRFDGFGRRFGHVTTSW